MTQNYPEDVASNLQRCASPGRSRGISWYALIAGILLILILIVPAQAGTLYTDGSPRITAVIAGSNEVSPGDSVNLTIMV